MHTSNKCFRREIKKRCKIQRQCKMRKLNKYLSWKARKVIIEKKTRIIIITTCWFHGISSEENFVVWIISATFETLTSFKVKRLATATSKLLLRHVLWHDVMMMGGFTRSGILLNFILLLILVNPLLAARPPSNRREKNRQQAQEERQSEFVKGKSKSSLSQSSRYDSTTLSTFKQHYLRSCLIKVSVKPFNVYLHSTQKSDW